MKNLWKICEKTNEKNNEKFMKNLWKICEKTNEKNNEKLVKKIKFINNHYYI